MTKQLIHGQKPTHRVYRIAGNGKAACWTPIGAAWPNNDGAGFSINCDAVPLAGGIVMHRITEPAEQGGQP